MESMALTGQSSLFDLSSLLTNLSCSRSFLAFLSQCKYRARHPVQVKLGWSSLFTWMWPAFSLMVRFLALRSLYVSPSVCWTRVPWELQYFALHTSHAKTGPYEPLLDVPDSSPLFDELALRVVASSGVGRGVEGSSLPPV